MNNINSVDDLVKVYDTRKAASPNKAKAARTRSLADKVAALIASANENLADERKITTRTGLLVASRAVAELSSLSRKSRQFGALRAVNNFITLASTSSPLNPLTASASALKNADLLPLGHPSSSSSKLRSLAAEKVRELQAEWYAADKGISEEVRPLVAAAFRAEFGSPEHTHAITRLSKAPVGSVPKDIMLMALVASFKFGNSMSSAARRARVALQLRDRRGRWIDMGRGLSFKFHKTDGSVGSASGSYVGQEGGASGDTGFALIQVKGHTDLPDGIYRVDGKKTESYQARIPGMRDAHPSPKSFDPSFSETEGIPNQADLIAGRTDTPLGWSAVSTDEKTGAKVYQSDDDYQVTQIGDSFTLHRMTKEGVQDKTAVGTTDSWAGVQKLATADSDAYDDFKNRRPAADREIKARLDRDSMSASRAKENEMLDKAIELAESGMDASGAVVPKGWRAVPSVDSGASMVAPKRPIVRYYKMVGTDPNQNNKPVYAVANLEHINNGYSGAIKVGPESENQYSYQPTRYDSWDDIQDSLDEITEAAGEGVVKGNSNHAAGSAPVVGQPMNPLDLTPDKNAADAIAKLPSDEEIYNERMTPGNTLQKVADKYGVDRKHVRAAESRHAKASKSTKSPTEYEGNDEDTSTKATLDFNELHSDYESIGLDADGDYTDEEALRAWLDKAGLQEADIVSIGSTYHGTEATIDIPNELRDQFAYAYAGEPSWESFEKGYDIASTNPDREPSAETVEKTPEDLFAEAADFLNKHMNDKGMSEAPAIGISTVQDDLKSAEKAYKKGDIKEALSQLEDVWHAIDSRDPGDGVFPRGENGEKAAIAVDELITMVEQAQPSHSLPLTADQKAGVFVDWPQWDPSDTDTPTGDPVIKNALTKNPNGKSIDIQLGEYRYPENSTGPNDFRTELDTIVKAANKLGIFVEFSPQQESGSGIGANESTFRFTYPYETVNRTDAVRLMGFEGPGGNKGPLGNRFLGEVNKEEYDDVYNQLTGANSSGSGDDGGDGGTGDSGGGSDESSSVGRDSTDQILDSASRRERGEEHILLSEELLRAGLVDKDTNQLSKDFNKQEAIDAAVDAFKEKYSELLNDAIEHVYDDSSEELPDPHTAAEPTNPSQTFGAVTVSELFDAADDQESGETHILITEEIHSQGFGDEDEDMPSTFDRNKTIEAAAETFRERYTEMLDKAIEQVTDGEPVVDDKKLTPMQRENLTSILGDDGFGEAGSYTFILDDDAEGISVYEGVDKDNAIATILDSGEITWTSRTNQDDYNEDLRAALADGGDDGDGDGGSGGVRPTPTPVAPVAPSDAAVPKQISHPDVPLGVFQFRGVEYEPEGRVDEESSNYTDDPKKLAPRYTVDDLVRAYRQAITGISPDAVVDEILNANVEETGETDADGNPIEAPRRAGRPRRAPVADTPEAPTNTNPALRVNNPSGAGQLEFSAGPEWVPAEALYNALWEAGVDPNRVTAEIYDAVNGNNRNSKALDNAGADSPEDKIVSDIMGEISAKRSKSRDAIGDALDNAPKDTVDSEEVALDEEFYKNFKNEPVLFNNVEYYSPDAEKYEPTVETPEEESGFSDDPVVLVETFTKEDLLEQFINGITDGSGSGVFNFGTDDTSASQIPVEAIRDALQLLGVDTNEVISNIPDESSDDTPEAEYEGVAVPAEGTPLSQLSKYDQVLDNVITYFGARGGMKRSDAIVGFNPDYEGAPAIVINQNMGLKIIKGYSAESGRSIIIDGWGEADAILNEDPMGWQRVSEADKAYVKTESSPSVYSGLGSPARNRAARLDWDSPSTHPVVRFDPNEDSTPVPARATRPTTGQRQTPEEPFDQARVDALRTSDEEDIVTTPAQTTTLDAGSLSENDRIRFPGDEDWYRVTKIAKTPEYPGDTTLDLFYVNELTGEESVTTMTPERPIEVGMSEEDISNSRVPIEALADGDKFKFVGERQWNTVLRVSITGVRGDNTYELTYKNDSTNEITGGLFPNYRVIQVPSDSAASEDASTMSDVAADDAPSNLMTNPKYEALIENVVEHLDGGLDDAELIAVNKDGTMMFVRAAGMPMIINHGNGAHEALNEDSYYVGPAGASLGWRPLTDSEKAQLTERITNGPSNSSTTSPEVVEPTPEPEAVVVEPTPPPMRQWPGPRERGYSSNNVAKDRRRNVMGNGDIVRATLDGRQGRVISIENKRNSSGEWKDYVRIRNNDGTTVTRSARQLEIVSSTYGLTNASRIAPSSAPATTAPEPVNDEIQQPLDERLRAPKAYAAQPVGDGSVTPGVENQGVLPAEFADDTVKGIKEIDFLGLGPDMAAQIAYAGRNRPSLDAVDAEMQRYFARTGSSNINYADDSIKKVKAMLRDIWGERGVKFGVNGYTVEWRNISLSASPRGNRSNYHFEGSVIDSAGNSVASITRSINSTNVVDANGTVIGVDRQANHAYLVFHGTEQKRNGFATAFNQYMEHWYYANKFDSIHVGAAGGGTWIGSYVWALQGFNFSSMSESVDFVSRLKSRARTKREKAAVDRLERMIANAEVGGRRDPSKMPTPIDIALVGWRPFAKEWLGQSVMKATSWGGDKNLRLTGGVPAERLVVSNYRQLRAADKRIAAGANKPNVSQEFISYLKSTNFQQHHPELEEHLEMLRDVISKNSSLAILSPQTKAALSTYVSREILRGSSASMSTQDALNLRKALHSEFTGDNPGVGKGTLGVGAALAKVSMEDVENNNVPGFKTELKIGAANNGSVDHPTGDVYKVTHLDTGQVFFYKNDAAAGEIHNIDPYLNEVSSNTILDALGMSSYAVIRSEVPGQENHIIMRPVGSDRPLGGAAVSAYEGEILGIPGMDSYDSADLIKHLARPDDVLRMLAADWLTNNGDRHNGNYMLAVSADDPSKLELMAVDNSVALAYPGSSYDAPFHEFVQEDVSMGASLYEYLPSLVKSMGAKRAQAFFEDSLSTMIENLKKPGAFPPGAKTDAIEQKWGSVSAFISTLEGRVTGMMTAGTEEATLLADIFKRLEAGF